jgi:hypothetical protein
VRRRRHIPGTGDQAPCPPIDRIPSLLGAKRRIYLTATLADDSILVTHFGADPQTIGTLITPETADDLGDRMILTPWKLILRHGTSQYLISLSSKQRLTTLWSSFLLGGVLNFGAMSQMRFMTAPPSTKVYALFVKVAWA